MDPINQSEGEVRARYFEQKIKEYWPNVYDIVGHKLSEFAELRTCWERAKVSGWWAGTLRADNYKEFFQWKQTLFGVEISGSVAARIRFATAGFEFTKDSVNSPSVNWPPYLAGDSQKKTCLVLEHIQDPAIYDNWRYALDPDNLMFEFNDLEAAYNFLSSRRGTVTQVKK